MKKTLLCFALLAFQLFTSTNLIAGEKINQSLDLGGNRQATWYIPNETANGWVLLQHGFQRNKSNLDDLANHYMDNGLMVLTINSSVTGGNASLAKKVANDLIDNPPTPPNGLSLPSNLVIAGHSAGGLFVSHISARLVERDYPNLKGVVLFDPVNASNGMQSTLQSVINSGKPVLSILANAGSCNSSNNALQPLRALSDAFVGIKLTNNSKHTDVEGSSTGGIITWLCGRPKASNTAYLKDFALNWTQDMVNGSYTSAYYPGGDALQALLNNNDGVLIKDLVTLPPVADFNFSASDFSVDFTNTSNDTDGNIVSYDWQFGDGQNAINDSPIYTYNNAGTYTVTLTVTDNDGQTGTISKNITLVSSINPPVANFTASVSELNIAVTNTSNDADGNIVDWNWSFGDGANSNIENPSHSYAQAGTYSIELTVTDNDGLSATTSQTIIVSSSQDAGSATTISNNNPVFNLGASTGDELAFVLKNVPAGTQQLTIQIAGGNGDADLHVKYASAPTPQVYDYRPYLNGNDESVYIDTPQAGDWYIMLRAYQGFSGATLTATYQ